MVTGRSPWSVVPQLVASPATSLRSFLVSSLTWRYYVSGVSLVPPVLDLVVFYRGYRHPILLHNFRYTTSEITDDPDLLFDLLLYHVVDQQLNANDAAGMETESSFGTPPQKSFRRTGFRSGSALTQLASQLSFIPGIERRCFNQVCRWVISLLTASSSFFQVTA